MVLELARKLVADQWSGASEVRVLTMLSEASTAAGDWTLASEMCARIVQAVEALRKRAARSARSERSEGAEGAEGADSTQQRKAAEDADAAADQAWRACFQLGKHGGWTSDPRKKLDVLGQALTLCPPERIQDILPAWNKLELQVAHEALLSEKEAKSAASRGKGTTDGPAAAAHAAEAAARAAASAAAGATAAGAVRVAGFLAAAAARGAHAASSTAGSNASSSSAAGTPTSPRSFSALQGSRRVASPTSAAHAGPSASHLAHETAAAASHTLRRAAAFFGGGGGGSGGGGGAGTGAGGGPSAVSPSRASVRSSTPGTPPRSPARGGFSADRPDAVASPPRTAGSRFTAALGSLTDPGSKLSRIPASPSRGGATERQAGGSGPPGSGASGGVTGFGLRAGLSNTLTAGVGWLIGADEMLEDERRRRLEEEEQQRSRAAAATADSDRAAARARARAGTPELWAPATARAASPAQVVPGPRPGSRAKLGAKPVGRTKLQATRVGGMTTAPKASAPPAQQEVADTDEWDAW